MSAPHPSRLALDRLSLGQGDEATRVHATGCAQCSAHLEALKVVTGAPDFVHPSMFALDRLVLGDADEATRTHAAACVRCTAHLKAVQVELPIPNWVKELEGTSRSAPLAWWRPAFAFAAMVAVALVFVVPQLAPKDPYIGDKSSGLPQTQVWVNRGGQISVWDGAPLHPEDAIRFEVKRAGFTHLTVVEVQEGKLFRVLHSAPIASDGLSPAWAVDDEGSQEEVVVLMSKAPLSDEELQRALAGEGTVWSTRWKFPKEVR